MMWRIYMKKTIYIFLTIFILTILFSFLTVKTSRAQLIVIGHKYEVAKVDIPKRRLEALNYKKKAGIIYVLINGKTKVARQNGEQADWTKIKVGDIITVYGGLTWDLKIRAKKIVISDT